MESMLSSVKARCLCEVLLEARRQAGLTQTQLAEKLLVPQSFVAKIENGDREVREVELPEIGHALGLSMGQLIARFEQAMQSAARPAIPCAPPARAPRRITTRAEKTRHRVGQNSFGRSFEPLCGDKGGIMRLDFLHGFWLHANGVRKD